MFSLQKNKEKKAKEEKNTENMLANPTHQTP